MSTFEPHGFLLLDKEEGLTSASLISRVKKKFNIKKIGHAGTLDPFATGLLVALVGGATKLSDYVMGGGKAYSGIIELGVSSSTDDCTGELTRVTTSIDFTSEELQKMIDENLIGYIDQVPPQVSAKKIKGKRAYDLVRENKNFELAASRVFVESFTIKKLTSRNFEFFVKCGKGTYIRALARDLGIIAGSGGMLATLRREESEPFSVKNAKKLDDIEISDILPWWSVFKGFPTYTLTVGEIEKVSHGNSAPLQCIQEDTLMILLCDDTFTPRGLAQKREGLWRRIFWI